MSTPPKSSGAIPSEVIDTIAQLAALTGPIGIVVGTVVRAVGAIKAAWPQAPVPDQGQLFADLFTSAQLGEAEVASLRSWVRTLPGYQDPNAPPPPTPPQT